MSTDWRLIAVVSVVLAMAVGCRPATLEPQSPTPPAPRPSATVQRPAPGEAARATPEELEEMLQQRLVGQQQGETRAAAFLAAIAALEQVDPVYARERLLQEIETTGDLALALAAGELADGMVDLILQRRVARAEAAATPQERAERRLELAQAYLQVGQPDAAMEAVRAVYRAIGEGQGEWRRPALEQMTGLLARIDVRKALTFIRDLKVRSPDLKTRLFAQAAPYWEEVDRRALERYLGQLRKSGARLDSEGYAHIVTGLAPAQPRLALSYVTRIDNPRLRYQALGEVLVALAREDPAQANAILERVRNADARRMLEEQLARAAGA